MNTEPTTKDLESPIFEAIWLAIKNWDISREQDEHRLYAGATGTDVKTILNAIQPFLSDNHKEV